MNKKWLMCIVMLMVACVPVFSQNIEQSGDIVVLASLLKEDAKLAEDNADKLIKKNKENTALIAAIGKVFLDAGKIDEAYRYFIRAQRCHKISTKALNLGGDIFLAKNNLDSARYFYERAMYFDRKDPDAYYKYTALFKAGEMDKAIEKLHVLERNRPDLHIDRKIGEIYFNADDYDNAIAAYEKIGLDSLAEKDLTNYSLAHFMKSHYAESLSLAEIGHKLYPRDPIFNRLLLYNYTEAKSYEEATKHAENLFHNSDNPTFQFRDYLYYGYALNGLGKTKEAVEQFDIALQKNIDVPDIKKQLSEAFAKINDYDNAIKYYESYLSALGKDDGNRAYDVFQLARLYWKKGTDTKDGDVLTPEKTEALLQANKLYAEIAVLRPDSYLGYYWQAQCNAVLDPNYQKGLAKPYYQKAAELLKKTGENQNTLIECYKQISYYYYTKKDYAMAQNYARDILAIDPDDDYAQQVALMKVK